MFKCIVCKIFNFYVLYHQQTKLRKSNGNNLPCHASTVKLNDSRTINCIREMTIRLSDFLAQKIMF